MRVLKSISRMRWLVIGVAVLLVGAAAVGGGTTLENRDAFCASCHTQPESEYVQRSANPAVDLASFHATEGVRCIDCHSGSGVTGRVKAEMLGMRDALVYISGNDTQPHSTTRPVGDVNCLKCHEDIGSARVFENHFHVLLPQWQAVSAGAATCADCHQGHQTNGQQQIAFLNEAHTVAVCQDCHRFAGEGG